ncbi:MAG: EAL domain-containing protein [Gammaproteobacteria bacterium]|nr:EAL domain-containing protein [Gammaproteobacteria bacterium]
MTLLPDRHDATIAAPIVLVVDDDPGIRLMVCEALEDAGWTPIEADDGLKALEIVEHTLPALVLLDVVMPGCDGFEVCAGIRAKEGAEHIPIMMMTGLDDLPAIKKAYEVGATDFLTKPLNYLILTERVRYILRATATANQLRESEARRAAATRISGLADWSWSPDTGVFEVSEELTELLGTRLTEAEFTFEHFLDHVHPEDRSAVEETLHALRPGQEVKSLEHRITRDDGEIVYVEQFAEFVDGDDGVKALVIGSTQDLSGRKKQEERMIQLAYYDELTGLPNRAFMLRQLRYSLAEAERTGTQCALLCISIDRFNRINTTLGHDTGDILLREVVERFSHSLRASDPFVANHDGSSLQDNLVDPRRETDTLARVGGDEFLLLLNQIDSANVAGRVAERALETIKVPFSIRDTEVCITASVGIAISEELASTPDSMLSRAKAAVQQAKESGRGEARFFDEAINRRSVQRMSTESKLRRAIEEERFELLYQPRVEPVSQRWLSAEALIRWNDPEQGAISPDDFIPIAEETGLIIPIGEWALRTACRQIAQINAHAVLCDFRVSVNLSGMQFHSGRVAGQVEDALNRSGLRAENLELEVTESILIDDTDQSFGLLDTLHEMGVELAIDDFGTGYSSMSYLKRLPLNTLKIDRCFTAGLLTDPQDQAIVTAIIGMAHSLGLGVVAEGVESVGQFHSLRTLKCDELQGFYFARPMAFAKLETALLAGAFDGPAEPAKSA